MDIDAVREFSRLLRPDSRILDAGCSDGRYLSLFRAMGFEAEGFATDADRANRAQVESDCSVWASDFVLLKLDTERYDGIWSHGALSALPSVGCQRTLAIFFRALKPAASLFVSIHAGQTRDRPEKNGSLYLYHPEDFASLLRQNGFKIMLEGHPMDRSDQVAFLCRRIPF